MTDPIADMLTRIRNAIGASRRQVILPHSKIKESIAAILKGNGFIADYRVDTSGQFAHIAIELHREEQAATITNLQRVSKPGRRVYAAKQDIPLILGGRGMVILSTSSGLMTGRDARRKGLGGELIMKVW